MALIVLYTAVLHPTPFHSTNIYWTPTAYHPSCREHCSFPLRQKGDIGKDSQGNSLDTGSIKTYQV